MLPEYQRSIQEAKQYISQTEHASQSYVHTQSVVDFALAIAQYFPDVDAQLIEVAAWWHDVGRLYSEDHEKISAEMAHNSLRQLHVESAKCRTVFNAIVFHKRTMQPQTIEGEIIRDADKLDFYSIPRWKIILQNKGFATLDTIATLLPTFREECLHLEISRTLFDKELISLLAFIKEIDDPDFMNIKNSVLEYHQR